MTGQFRSRAASRQATTVEEEVTFYIQLLVYRAYAPELAAQAIMVSKLTMAGIA